ncbi:hypothetical protein KDL01_06805 [Actinospica durhamensis]|uniref:Uncharacterized protein n=1 Tax=Actinospica durhamensis TaxID=1508375 RepID=A0A941IMK5_9ACTN|nr:hypothetical protein [Actinospica durhamensis]MBR7832964.1 hypothetical protein [Actinospica durhamensis]
MDVDHQSGEPRRSDDDGEAADDVDPEALLRASRLAIAAVRRELERLRTHGRGGIENRNQAGAEEAGGAGPEQG